MDNCSQCACGTEDQCKVAASCPFYDKEVINKIKPIYLATEDGKEIGGWGINISPAE